jgi:hypothetical protein
MALSDMAAWIAACPDPDTFSVSIATAVWREEFTNCASCECPTHNKDLRSDDAYWKTNLPICQRCYMGFNDDAPMENGVLDFDWPPEPDWTHLRTSGVLVNGALIDGCHVIGHVEGYNTQTHSATSITLFGMELNPTCGPVHPTYTVENRTPCLSFDRYKIHHATVTAVLLTMGQG